jgi:hypothetical protein
MQLKTMEKAFWFSQIPIFRKIQFLRLFLRVKKTPRLFDLTARQMRVDLIVVHVIIFFDAIYRQLSFLMRRIKLASSDHFSKLTFRLPHIKRNGSNFIYNFKLSVPFFV